MKRFKVTTKFSYYDTCDILVTEGERTNDNVQAENEEAAKAEHLKMVLANEPKFVELKDQSVEEFKQEEGQ